MTFDLFATLATVHVLVYAGVFLLKKDALDWFGIRRAQPTRPRQ